MRSFPAAAFGRGGGVLVVGVADQGRGWRRSSERPSVVTGCELESGSWRNPR